MYVYIYIYITVSGGGRGVRPSHPSMQYMYACTANVLSLAKLGLVTAATFP